MFCFVFKRFCLTFKVVHVYESISYFTLYLFACCICCLHVYSACGFVSLHDCTVFMFVFVFRLHNKDKYPFTKIFVLVKGIREFNIFFSKVSVSTNLTFEVNVSQYRWCGVIPRFPKTKKQLPKFWWGGNEITIDQTVVASQILSAMVKYCKINSDKMK